MERPLDLESLVAWVADADEPRGKGIALALAARGARVLVTGRDERAIAECVGEIAHGGGKARHFVSEAVTARGVGACVEAAKGRFGALDVAVVAEGADDPSRHVPTGAVRVVALASGLDETAAVDAVLARLAHR